MKKLSALIMAVVLMAGLLVAPAANALVTTFTTEASWLTAVGSGSVLENFNDSVLAGPLTSITGGTYPYAGSNAFSDRQVFHGVTTGTNSVTFNFSTAISALGGFWDLNGPGGPGANITLNLIGGGTETFLNFFSNTLAGSFQGFATSSAFTSMTLSNGTFCSGCIETFELENLRISPVPEPETYAMFIVGLGLIGFMARRRKEDFNS